MRRRLLLAAIVLLAAAGPAAARDWVIAPGRVDPPYGPQRSVGAPFAALERSWGPPLAPAVDVPVAVWPRGLEVTLRRAPRGAAVKFAARGQRWRTPSGARRGTTEARLRRIYGDRLQPVTDERGLLGVTRHWMAVYGDDALGFVMRPGRVLAIITGRTAVVRADLRFSGPL
ncbi:MAG: hypothetical protein AB7V42_01435 [Thermoleophilia bacterium]